MRITNTFWACLLVVGCGGTDRGPDSNTQNALTAEEEDELYGDGDGEDDSGDGDGDDAGDGDGDGDAGDGDGDGDGDDCGQTPPECTNSVDFDCDEITVHTCKDLSNVVIEYADGSTERFEDLLGYENSFGGDGKEIVGVWVKAGSNHSGDGPGYGERFDAPADSCEPGDGDGGDGDGDAGDGDGEGDAGDGDGDGGGAEPL
jgi:hypothetical protein